MGELRVKAGRAGQVHPQVRSSCGCAVMVEIDRLHTCGNVWKWPEDMHARNRSHSVCKDDKSPKNTFGEMREVFILIIEICICK